jgi:hypothetical protein
MIGFCGDKWGHGHALGEIGHKRLIERLRPSSHPRR